MRRLQGCGVAFAVAIVASLPARPTALAAAPAAQVPAEATQAHPPSTPPAPVKKVPPDQVIALLGQPVIGPLGAVEGRVVDVLVNQKGVPQAAVIDFGGFMGVGSRKIAVHWNTLHFNPGDPKYPVVLDLLPDQIKAAPAYEGESKPAAVVIAPWEAAPTAEPAKPGEQAKTVAPKTVPLPK